MDQRHNMDKVIRKAQSNFSDVAESIGVKNEEDVIELVREVRYGKNHL